MWWGADENNLLNALDKVFVVWRTLVFSPLLTSVCSSISRSRGVERYTQGDRCLTTGNTRAD